MGAGGRSARRRAPRACLALQMGCEIQFVCVEMTPIPLPQNIRAGKLISLGSAAHTSRQETGTLG